MNGLVLVCAGGALGSLARYGTGRLVTHRFKKHAASATVLVNILGAFMLGIILKLNMQPAGVLLIIDGFLGAFTTFSSFIFEAFELIRTKNGIGSFIYIVLMLLGGIAAFLIGNALF